MADDDPPDVSVELADFKAQLAKVLKSQDVQAYFDMAVAYEEMGLIAEALGALANVEKGGGTADQKLAHLLHVRARTREGTGDLAGALLDYQRIRAADPDDAEASAAHARLSALVLLA